MDAVKKSHPAQKLRLIRRMPSVAFGCAGVLALTMAATEASGEQPEQVGLWSCWEKTFKAGRGYDDPLRDVRVTATFTDAAGRKVEREAFHDGQDRWVCRFAPDVLGSWEWVLRSEPEDPGLRGTGSIKCVRSDLHGPLRVDPENPLWFRCADGTPVYVLAFHLWRAEALDEKTLRSTLDGLCKQGFNAVYGPHLWADRSVWARSGDGKPDYSRFDLEVWGKLDRFVRAAAERRMLIFPFSIMGGTNSLPAPRDPEARDLFLRYWVARWGAFWNATFQMVSEYEEAYSDEEILKVGSRLRQLDGGRHLISVHSQKSGSPAVQKADWYGYHTVQLKLGHRAGHGEAADDDPLKYRSFVDLHRRVPKPILAQECLWEGNFYQAEVGLDVDKLRQGAWVIALSGGQINYADEVVPPRRTREQKASQSRTFSMLGTQTQPVGRLYPALSHLAAFLRWLPFERLKPHPEMAGTGVCLAEPGETYVVYSLKGGTIELDLTGTDHSFDCQWLDPRSGQRQAGPTLVGGARRGIRTPDDRKDWVLLARAQKGPRAGPAGQRAARPNIVLIFTDDQVFRALGCAGNRAIHTPNLDRLAEQGTRFSTTIIASPVCVASRCSLWSGLYPQQHGSTFLDNQPFIKKVRAGDLKTLPQYLSGVGYTSGYCGKSHLGDPKENLGFDEGREYMDGSDTKAFEWAERFLTERAGSEKPFFLCVATHQPHIPLKPPDRWREFYKPQQMPIDPNYREAPLPSSLTNQGAPGQISYRDHGGPASREEAQRVTALYYGEVSNLDEQVGRLMRQLADLGLDRKTLVIFLSDNGYHLGNHGVGNKLLMYEESIRVPLIVRYPGVVPEGRVTDQTASSLDIMPTILDFAGIAIPRCLEGTSLKPLLTGQASHLRDAAFSECCGVAGLGIGHRMVRTRQWKYMLSDSNEEGLFNLDRDPYEMKNLIEETEARQELARLRSMLAGWMDHVRDGHDRPPLNK